MKTMTEEIRKKQQEIQKIRSYACMGCNGYVRHFTGLVYTDHIQQIAEIAEAYWLIDAIGSYLHQFKQPFQLWELKVNEDNSAVLTMKEDTNKPVLVKQEIRYTDFPLDEIKLYVELGCVDCVNPEYILLLPESR